MTQTAHPKPAPAKDTAAPAARIACCIVTWNRPDDAIRVIEALTRQSLPTDLLDVVLVDNASDESVAPKIAARFGLDRSVRNTSQEVRTPEFAVEDRSGNTARFASLSVVRNADNFGGCGGFNTAMRFVRAALPETELVWLLDDDIDLDDQAGERLLRTIRSSGDIGIAGSRTVDIRDRETTLETTIYQDARSGMLGPNPHESDPRACDHAAWAGSVGGSRGGSGYTGTRDVDVVAASSLMARWDLALQVGLWDDRYFIYCDDADWCLRFGRAGYRVVLDLDSVAYHTPWFEKLTPTRSYYAHRNIVFTIAKGPSRRRLLFRRLGGLLKGARREENRELAQAMLCAAHDAAVGRGGRYEPRRLNLAWVAILCAIAVAMGRPLRGG